MRIHSLFFAPLLLTNLITPSLSAIQPQQVAQALALASGLYVMYAEATQTNWNLSKPFRAGGGSALIAAGIMKAIEVMSETYWCTDFFTSTLLGKTVKILASVGVALGFCQYLGVYKHMAQDKQRKWAYIKGLICGTLLLLPFCNDFQ